MPTLLAPFQIERPSTLAEASEMLTTFADTGRAYAGGTELLLAMKKGGLAYEHLVDLKTIPDLTGIQERDGGLEIGALATHMAIERSQVVKSSLPVLVQLEKHVANPRVRATGTLGGNLCFGEPHSDPATLLLALEARLHLFGPDGERELGTDEFIVDSYEVALGEGELLRSITIPTLQPTQRASYQKFQVHEYPMLGLALVVNLDERGSQITDARLAIGSVSPFPRRSATAEQMLVGEVGAVAEKLKDAANTLADEAEMLDDLEGTADYKRHLVYVFLERAFEEVSGRGGHGAVH